MKMLKLIFLLISLPGLVFSKALIDSENGKLSGINLFYNKNLAGGEVFVFGESLISNNNKLKVNSIKNVKWDGEIEKAFLLWSIKTNKKNINESVIFITPSAKAGEKVRAIKAWGKEDSVALNLLAFDVTDKVLTKGEYGIRSNYHTKSPNLKVSVAGWALIIVTQNSTSNKKNNIYFRLGVGQAHPGRIFNLDISPGKNPSRKWKKLRLISIGGNALSGNGSANLINGKSISGVEDWDGSSGVRWDIDEFFISRSHYKIKNEKLIFMVDSLLQWVFPVAVITNFEN